MSPKDIAVNLATPAVNYTVDEFEAYADSPENRDRLLELINREIVEKVLTQEYGLYAGNIYAPLWNSLVELPCGIIIRPLSMGVSSGRCPARLLAVGSRYF